MPEKVGRTPTRHVAFRPGPDEVRHVPPSPWEEEVDSLLAQHLSQPLAAAAASARAAQQAHWEDAVDADDESSPLRTPAERRVAFDDSEDTPGCASDYAQQAKVPC